MLDASERIYLSGMELLRLNYCATSSRLGQIDQGFPNTMKLLAAKGLVEVRDKGFVATDLGFETLKLYQRELKSL